MPMPTSVEAAEPLTPTASEPTSVEHWASEYSRKVALAAAASPAPPRSPTTPSVSWRTHRCVVVPLGDALVSSLVMVHSLVSPLAMTTSTQVLPVWVYP